MKQVDTAYEVETPEGVVLKLRVAGLPVRYYAYLLDFLYRWLINIAVGIIFSIVGMTSLIGFFLIYLFLMEWFYPVYFEVYRKGQTPGKKQMKIKVLNGDGTPIGWQASLIRSFLLMIDTWLFGFISCLIDKRFRRLGDLAADTIVVYEKETKSAKLPDVKASHPPVNLNVEEQKAVIAFAERSSMLSAARKQELAEILSSLHEKKKDKAVKAVIKYAAALSGKVGK